MLWRAEVRGGYTLTTGCHPARCDSVIYLLPKRRRSAKLNNSVVACDAGDGRPPPQPDTIGGLRLFFGCDMHIDHGETLSVWVALKKSKFADLRTDLVDLAIRYARLRVDYYLADGQEQVRIGSTRSACHNALISACDILARNMKAAGEDATWRDTLGNDRRDIGDFACHLHAILGISVR